MAYSTWYRRPSGLNVVVRVSYRRLMAATNYLRLPFLARNRHKLEKVHEVI
jgi:hypothetical protein